MSEWALWSLEAMKEWMNGNGIAINTTLMSELNRMRKGTCSQDAVGMTGKQTVEALDHEMASRPS